MRSYWRVSGFNLPMSSSRHPRRNIADDNCDDNPDDSCTPNNAHDNAKMVLSCLVVYFARSWQCGGQGFESP